MTKLSLDDIELLHGSHPNPEVGMCVMEAVAYVAGEPHSDHPKCSSRVLTDLLIGLNDRWDTADRQLLKPFIPRLVGTNTGPEDEETRRWMVTDWLVHEYAPAIFRHVGLTAEAEQFEQLGAIASLSDYTAARGLIYEVRDAQWKRRAEARKRLKGHAVAAAVAAAVANAVAAAVADAAAVANAVANAVADADANAAAVANAVAAAVANAVAAAVANAAAVAVAVANAVAAADADAAAFKSKVEEATAVVVAVAKRGDGYHDQYWAAKAVFRPFYDERYKAMFGELGLKQSVLGLVDQLIAVSDGKTAPAA